MRRWSIVDVVIEKSMKSIDLLHCAFLLCKAKIVAQKPVTAFLKCKRLLRLALQCCYHLLEATQHFLEEANLYTTAILLSNITTCILSIISLFLLSHSVQWFPP